MWVDILQEMGGKLIMLKCSYNINTLRVLHEHEFVITNYYIIVYIVTLLVVNRIPVR